MKKIKIIVDIIFTFLMILLMDTNTTGMKWHEIIGVSLLFVIAIHLILNLKWIKAVSVNIFKGEITNKVKLIYLFDFITLVSGILTIIFGIGISTTILTNIEFKNIELFTILHKLIAAIFLVCLSIHLGVHISKCIIKFKTMMKMSSSDLKFSEKILIFIFLIFGMISYFKDQNIKDILNSINFSKKLESKIDVKTYASTNQEEVVENTINIESKDEEYVLVSSNIISSDELSKKLSGTFCTGCGRHCPLSSPRCQRGVQQANALKEKYVISDSTTSTKSSSDTNENVTTNTSTNTTTNIVDSNQTTTNNYVSNNNDSSENTTSSTTNDIIYNVGEMGFWIAGTYYVISKKNVSKKNNS